MTDTDACAALPPGPNQKRAAGVSRLASREPANHPGREWLPQSWTGIAMATLKVFLLGESGSGKTTLKKALQRSIDT